MVIYEVNLTINNDIFQAYSLWLPQHIEKMLTFKGFNQAEISTESSAESKDTNKTKLTVRYTVNHEENLNDYLKNEASHMRMEAVEKFGNQFSASRRIFKDIIILKSKHEEK